MSLKSEGMSGDDAQANKETPKGSWIRLYRSLANHELWLSAPFSPGQAWIDLLMNACYQETQKWIGTSLVSVPRGGWLVAELRLAERWKWSRTKVRHFLESLQAAGMVERQDDGKKTIVLIVNYKQYQGIAPGGPGQKDSRETIDEQFEGSAEAIGEQSKSSNKKKSKKSKKNQKTQEGEEEGGSGGSPCFLALGEHVQLTAQDLEKLIKVCALGGEREAHYWIQTFDLAFAQHPDKFRRKYSDHLATIRNWRKRALEEGKVWDPVRGLYTLAPAPRQQLRGTKPVHGIPLAEEH